MRTGAAVGMLVSIFAASAGRAEEATLVNVAPHVEDATTVSIPLRLAIQTEAASGIVTGRFYNQLVGLRLDAQFSPQVSFGGYLGYANLKGKDGRASDLLPYAQLEYRTGAPGDTVRIPLRFASGYLPRNGPVVRLAAGLAFALTPRVDLVTELAPMIWVTNNQTLLSMNLALELAFRL